MLKPLAQLQTELLRPRILQRRSLVPHLTLHQQNQSTALPETLNRPGIPGGSII